MSYIVTSSITKIPLYTLTSPVKYVVSRIYYSCSSFILSLYFLLIYIYTALYGVCDTVIIVSIVNEHVQAESTLLNTTDEVKYSFITAVSCK